MVSGAAFGSMNAVVAAEIDHSQDCNALNALILSPRLLLYRTGATLRHSFKYAPTADNDNGLQPKQVQRELPYCAPWAQEAYAPSGCALRHRWSSFALAPNAWRLSLDSKPRLLPILVLVDSGVLLIHLKPYPMIPSNCQVVLVAQQNATATALRLVHKVGATSNHSARHLKYWRRTVFGCILLPILCQLC